MRTIIGSKLKKNAFLYRVYFFIGNIFILILKFFFRKPQNIILFSSFGGKKIDDSPYEIFKEMKKRDTFRNFRLVWATDRNKSESIVDDVISINSIEFFKIAIQSKLWITNSSMQRGLLLKKNETIYLNTWHGTPMKYMGSDILDKNQDFQIREDKKDVDFFLVQGSFEKNIFKNAFSMDENQFLSLGYPRNDRLTKLDISQIKLIKDKLGISKEKKIILYAPTFRPEVTDKKGRIVFDPQFEIRKLVDNIGSEYVLLIRAHYEAYIPNIDIGYKNQVINVSNYSNLNDLLIISDLLISDYSSIFFDYALLSRPMIAYVYDYNEYSETRGLYFDIRNFLPSASTMDELIGLISNLDISSKKYIEKTERFQKRFVEWYGNATVETVNFVEKIFNKD